MLSWSTSAANRSGYDVAVLRVNDGRGGSRQVHERLLVGTKVGVRGPRNHFPLVPGRHYLFIAGGIGITPLLLMLRAVHESGAEWQLVYGGRTRASMAFRDQLVERFPERVDAVAHDERGALDLETVLGDATNDTLVYSCGPEAMLVAIEERCADRPPESLHQERFSPGRGPACCGRVRLHPRAGRETGGARGAGGPDDPRDPGGRRHLPDVLLSRGHMRHVRNSRRRASARPP